MPPSRADAVVARARGLVGTRFVPHGRDPDHGLDCIGLVAAALQIAPPPALYTLRCCSVDLLHRGLEESGLEPVPSLERGDLVAVRAGPGQLHLGIWSGASLIHADAGLRRVVERPAPLPWPVIGMWRLPRQEEEASWRH